MGSVGVFICMSALLVVSWFTTMLLEFVYKREMRKMIYNDKKEYAEFEIRNGARRGQLCYAKFNDFMQNDIIDCYIPEGNEVQHSKFMRDNLKIIDIHSDFNVETV